MYTAVAMEAYGTGAGYFGAPAHAYTTRRGVAMCRSPKAAIRQARLAVLRQPVGKLVDGVLVGQEWEWIPVAESITLYRDGVRIYGDLS